MLNEEKAKTVRADEMPRYEKPEVHSWPEAELMANIEALGFTGAPGGPH